MGQADELLSPTTIPRMTATMYFLVLNAIPRRFNCHSVVDVSEALNEPDLMNVHTIVGIHKAGEVMTSIRMKGDLRGQGGDRCRIDEHTDAYTHPTFRSIDA